VEEQYTQEYVQLLCADIKSLQKQLVESEFNCTRLKLQNDQTTERIKVIQEEFTKEISRCKTAEATLAQLQNDNRTTEIATLNASSKTAQLENAVENLRSEIAELNIQKINLQKEIGDLNNVKRSFSGSPLR
jgi:chromosome segregation ATPase